MGINYQETLTFLFEALPMYQRQGKAAYKADLKNTLLLDASLNHPHKNFKSIHVAGTNGKGSVSHMLASIMQAAGYKTGLYTSPHLLDFRERIKVNGEMIPESYVVSFVEKIKKEIEEIQPSFFEMTVAMAFDYFEFMEIDVAIIETGMGGRLDSTNILSPEISIITNISKDHTFFLGDTIEKIAIEKGGIIKENTPIVIGKNIKEAFNQLQEIASKNNSLFIDATKKRSFKYQTNSIGGGSVFYFLNNTTHATESWESDLEGSYQAENLQTVLATTEQLIIEGWNLSKKSISDGIQQTISKTGLRGRWETLGANPRIICDNAHNSAGIAMVMNQLEKIPCKNLHIVWGMVNDKDIDAILPLLPKKAFYYFTSPSIPRGMPVNELAKHGNNVGLNSISFNTVSEAILSAKQNSLAEDTIFIGGSTFVVADALTYFS